MKKIISISLISILAGCSTKPIPVPIPDKSCILIPGKGCRQINAGNVGGTTLGNHDESILEESTR